MRTLALVLLLAALAGTYWLYTAPQRLLQQLKAAADTNDAPTFQRLADVPAMQANMLAQLLGPPDPSVGPILVTGLSMLSLNQTATPHGVQPYLRAYRAPVLGLWGGQGGAGRYAATGRYLFTTSGTSASQPGSTLVLRRRGLTWQLLTIQLPSSEITNSEPVPR
jgi:hypothetical protein